MKNQFLIRMYYIQKKSGLSMTLKVSTLNFRIKESRLKESHSKVPISGSGSIVFDERIQNPDLHQIELILYALSPGF